MSDAQQRNARPTGAGGDADAGGDPSRDDRGESAAQDDEVRVARERRTGTDGDEARDHPDGIQIQTE